MTLWNPCLDKNHAVDNPAGPAPTMAIFAVLPIVLVAMLDLSGPPKATWVGPDQAPVTETLTAAYDGPAVCFGGRPLTAAGRPGNVRLAVVGRSSRWMTTHFSSFARAIWRSVDNEHHLE